MAFRKVRVVFANSCWCQNVLRNGLLVVKQRNNAVHSLNQLLVRYQSNTSSCNNNNPSHVHVHKTVSKQSSPFSNIEVPSPKQKLSNPISAAPLSSISESDHINNITTVQTRDYEHSYLPGILLSKNSSSTNNNENQIDMQKFYFALRAFHIEIASIRINERDNTGGLSSGSNLASLRMRWWKESLNFLYENDDDISLSSSNKKSKASSGNVGSNPTIRSLKHVITTQKLSRPLFETMIDARLDDLQKYSDTNNDNFLSMDEMIDFYSKTISSLLLLHLECCGVKLFNNDVSGIIVNEDGEDVEKVKEVVNCIGIGIGCINAIRSINTGQVGIPDDLIQKYSINTNDIFDPRSIISNQNEKGHIAIQNAIKDMASIAKKYLYHARLHQSIIPKGDAKLSLLSVVSALRYLERLEQLNYDVFDEKLREVENVESFNGRMWRLGGMFHLWRAWLTGIF